jgi:hypothetical protein
LSILLRTVREAGHDSFPMCYESYFALDIFWHTYTIPHFLFYVKYDTVRVPRVL